MESGLVPSKLDVACINIKVHVVLFPDIESYLLLLLLLSRFSRVGLCATP